MGRSPCCDKANVKRGPWSHEEDEILKSYLNKHGSAGNWIALPLKAGLKRCGKSCRLRWLNYLRPHIKHGAFTDDEDKLISTLYATIGSRWSLIAAQLPGRTDNDVKNHWNTKLRKKFFAGGINTANATTVLNTASSKFPTFTPQIEAFDHNNNTPTTCFESAVLGLYQTPFPVPSKMLPLESDISAANPLVIKEKDHVGHQWLGYYAEEDDAFLLDFVQNGFAYSQYKNTQLDPSSSSSSYI
ncbi:hypothetical protein HN51_036403 [Arachis hypogaea]|uniref:Transcription factor n=1 Tax=Arachis hypogaea TaxID=3818 RepID=A0A445A092_ARAHY|nr:transcription factor RAX1-like [Arachis ipaensis]XP_025641148.1 transcription factor RAX1 [Arachis hypogaea]RYR19841.1 hypothetical protein Ahy_B03g064735 [Arachis hypogaea]